MKSKNGFFIRLMFLPMLIYNTVLAQPLIKSQRPIPLFHLLTSQDKKNYFLNVDQKTVTKPYDTIIARKKIKIISIHVKLSNHSNDTLRYITMSCSYSEIYELNNDKLKILFEGCDKNVPTVLQISPHQSSIVNIPLIYPNRSTSDKVKFKIGMSLQKYVSIRQLSKFEPYVYMLRSETSNIIWSNEVFVP